MRDVLPFAALLLIVGCATSPKERLEGRWVGEVAESFPAGQSERVQGWARGAAFEFRGSRVTVSVPAESPRHGTFKVASIDDDQLRVTFLRAHGAADEVTFLFEGEDKLRWMLDGGRSIVMRRAIQ